jgi:DNA polymerase-3 subunit beta
MKFEISREMLLKPLSLVAGVVERRQTLPVLSNVLIVVDGDQLLLTGTDLEVELIGRATLDQVYDSGEVTVPARKLVDICKTLPEGSVISISLEGDKLIVKSGRSRFSLSTLPAADFPNIEEGPQSLGFMMTQGQMRCLIDRTSIAMAQQDVRYYLNGMLFEITTGHLKAVATDGHRLALCEVEADVKVTDALQIIVPRKGVMELNRLLVEDDETVIKIAISTNHICVVSESLTFTSKLVDGKFPDYRQVIPKDSTKELIAEREQLKQVLSRAAILSNEKYRGIRFVLEEDLLQVFANNPEQEEAEESLAVHYKGELLEVGFNVSYLLDVLSVTSSENIKVLLSDANSSALIKEVSGNDNVEYVVMPMRL